MYRRYYSYSDMPRIIDKEKKEEKKEIKSECKKPQEDKKIFGKFEADDIILGIVILAILLDDSDDNLLLIALAAVFLAGLI